MDDAGLLGLAAWIAATVRSATPLLFAILGETLTQRVGIINLGIEGEMLVGACFGFAVAAATGNPLLGLLAGAGAGAVLSFAHAALVLFCRANQIGSGLAVWMIGLGVTAYAGIAYVGKEVEPLPSLAAPGESFFATLLSQLTPTALVGPVFVLFVGVWLYRTRTGLSWRTVGESEEAARAAGLRPDVIRLLAILAGGVLAGIGGAILSIDYTLTWAPDMTKGTGLVAVGLVIVARWNPFLGLPVALLFGLSQAAVQRLPASGIVISSHLLACIPYVVAVGVIVLAQLSARRGSGMPAELKAVFGR